MEKAWPKALLPHMPSVQQLLADGPKYDLAHVEWGDMEMKTLALKCASALYLELGEPGTFQEDSTSSVPSEWHKRANNLLSFLTKYADPDIMVFGAKIMLATYSLPINPGKMKGFHEFHMKAGHLVVDSVEGAADIMERVEKDIAEITATNDNVVEYVDYRAIAKEAERLERQEKRDKELEIHAANTVRLRSLSNDSMIGMSSRIRPDSVAARQARGSLPQPNGHVTIGGVKVGTLS